MSVSKFKTNSASSSTSSEYETGILTQAAGDDVAATILGCVLCSKLAIVAYEILDERSNNMKTRYCNRTRSAPVYCTLCLVASMGYCSNTRLAEDMTISTEV